MKQSKIFNNLIIIIIIIGAYNIHFSPTESLKPNLKSACHLSICIYKYIYDKAVNATHIHFKVVHIYFKVYIITVT